MSDRLPVLYVVVPCFNEEEVLPVSSQALKAELLGMIARKMIDAGSRILFVNDGSRDGTWELIRRLHESDPVFCGISLSHNRARVLSSPKRCFTRRSRTRKNSRKYQCPAA